MADMRGWQAERETLGRTVEALRVQGTCDTCYDLEHGGELYGNQYPIFEDDLLRVKLELYARARGHTIVVYKPHRMDISDLADGEASHLFEACVRLVKAIKVGLGAEKVYVVTMCDGILNHLHVQLLPRYAGEPIGSTRFVAPRASVTDGDATSERIPPRIGSKHSDSSLTRRPLEAEQDEVSCSVGR